MWIYNHWILWSFIYSFLLAEKRGSCTLAFSFSNREITPLQGSRGKSSNSRSSNSELHEVAEGHGREYSTTRSRRDLVSSTVPKSLLPPQPHPRKKSPPTGLAKTSLKQITRSSQSMLSDAEAELEFLSKLPKGFLNSAQGSRLSRFFSSLYNIPSTKSVELMERILTRLSDEVWAGNKEIMVTKTMYIRMFLVWGRHRADLNRERIISLFEDLKLLYKETGDPMLCPDASCYCAVLHTFMFSQKSSAAAKAEVIWGEMVSNCAALNHHHPYSTMSLRAVLRLLAGSQYPDRVERGEKLMEQWKSLGMPQSPFLASEMQKLYALSDRDDAYEKSYQLLQQMAMQNSTIDRNIETWELRPAHVVNVLATLKNKTKEIANLTEDIMTRMENPVNEGGYNLKISLPVCVAAIKVGRTCPDKEYGAKLAEWVLQTFEKKLIGNLSFSEVFSSFGHPQFLLPAFNHGLRAMSRDPNPKVGERMLQIIRRMEKFAENGLDYIEPNSGTWNAYIEHLVNRHDEEALKEAEDILRMLVEQHSADEKKACPTIVSYSHIVEGYCNLASKKSAFSADDIMKEIEHLFSVNKIKNHASNVLYDKLCWSWARKDPKIASTRIPEIISQMVRSGLNGLQPLSSTYEACIEALCAVGQVSDAEVFLYRMIRRAKRGDRKAIPSTAAICMVAKHFQAKGLHRRVENLIKTFTAYSAQFPQIDASALLQMTNNETMSMQSKSRGSKSNINSSSSSNKKYVYQTMSKHGGQGISPKANLLGSNV